MSNSRHLRSPRAVKCYTELLILPIHRQGLQREVRIRPVVVGVEGPPTDSDTNPSQRTP